MMDLVHSHKYPRLYDLQKEKKWAQKEGMEVSDRVGKRVGILGYGSIGRQGEFAYLPLYTPFGSFLQGHRHHQHGTSTAWYLQPGCNIGSRPSTNVLDHDAPYPARYAGLRHQKSYRGLPPKPPIADSRPRAMFPARS
jgi:hypothetical protein